MSPALQPLIRETRFENRDEAYQDTIEQLGEEYADVITPDQVNQTFYVNLVDPSQSASSLKRFSRDGRVSSRCKTNCSTSSRCSRR